MKLRIMSDLHLEFDKTAYSIPKGDKDTVLVVAGDIGLGEKPIAVKNFMKDCSEQFKEVVCIAGNHEFYNGYWPYSLTKLRKELADFKNVHILEKSSIIIDNVLFIGATLWSDFDNCDVICRMDAKHFMNDFRIIRTGPANKIWERKLTTNDVHADHIVAKNFIFETLYTASLESELKTVVITHHAPSYMSIAPEFKNSTLNGAYASDLSEEILTSKPNIWIHGHTHASLDYMLGDTRIICNPRGYEAVGQGNPTFDSNFELEI